MNRIMVDPEGIPNFKTQSGSGTCESVSGLPPRVTKLRHRRGRNGSCQSTIRPCSRDPIGFFGGINAYGNYFGVQGSDPSGHFAIAVPLFPVISVGNVLNVIAIACLLYPPCRNAAIEELEGLIEGVPWPPQNPEPERKPEVNIPGPIPPKPPNDCDKGKDDECPEGQVYCCDIADGTWELPDGSPGVGGTVFWNCGCRDSDDCWDDGTMDSIRPYGTKNGTPTGY